MECIYKNTMCRLCLRSNEPLVDIFEENSKHGYVAAEVIEDLLHLQVSREDSYPPLICEKCLDKLTEFRQFKSQCHISMATYDNVYSAEELILKQESLDSEDSVIYVEPEEEDKKMVTAEQIEMNGAAVSEKNMLSLSECADSRMKNEAICYDEIDEGNLSFFQEEDFPERDPLSDSNAFQEGNQPKKTAKMTYGKGVRLCNQSRLLIKGLRDYFVTEKYYKGPLIDCEEVIQRSAAALGMSEEIIKKICEKMKKIPQDVDPLTTITFSDHSSDGKGTRLASTEKILFRDGMPLKNQPQELVYSVVNYFQREKDNGGPLLNCDKVLERTTAAVGVGKTTVLRICRELEERGKAGRVEARPDTARMIGLSPRGPMTGLDFARKEAIRSHIRDYYVWNEVPSVTNLLRTLKNENLFHGSKGSLVRVLKSIGFDYKRLRFERVWSNQRHS